MGEIKCTVKNCINHDSSNHCVLGSICICSSCMNCSTCLDTICPDFEEKK